MSEQKQLGEMSDLELKGAWFDQVQIMEQVKLNLDAIKQEMVSRIQKKEVKEAV